MNDQGQQTSSRSKIVTTPSSIVDPAEPVQVYVSGALTGVSDLAELKCFYEAIAEACREQGLKPYVPHLHTEPGTDHSPQQVFWTDKTTVLESGLVLAYMGHPSFGVGMEVAYAEEYGIPVIFLYREGTVVSRMPRGIPSLFREIIYVSQDDALAQLHDALVAFLTEHIIPL